MGLSQDHSITFRFDDPRDAERFEGYINRFNEQERGSRGADWDRWIEVKDEHQNWNWDGVTDGYDRDTIWLGEVEDNTVELTSSGYGTIPPHLVLSAIEQYNCTEFYGKTSPCQCQEGLRWHYHYLAGECTWFQVPDWAPAY